MRNLTIQQDQKFRKANSSYKFKANSASPEVKAHVKGFGSKKEKDPDKTPKKETLLEQLLKLEKEGEELRFTPTQIEEVRKQIAALTSEEEQEKYYLLLQRAVKYKSQRDNQSMASVYEREIQGRSKVRDYMCNLTVLAMCLEYLGIDNPTKKKGQQFDDYLEDKRVELSKEYQKEIDKEFAPIKEKFDADMLVLNQKKQVLAQEIKNKLVEIDFLSYGSKGPTLPKTVRANTKELDEIYDKINGIVKDELMSHWEVYLQSFIASELSEANNNQLITLEKILLDKEKVSYDFYNQLLAIFLEDKVLHTQLNSDRKKILNKYHISPATNEPAYRTHHKVWLKLAKDFNVEGKYIEIMSGEKEKITPLKNYLKQGNAVLLSVFVC